MKKYGIILFILVAAMNYQSEAQQKNNGEKQTEVRLNRYDEHFRPQYHFSPQSHWMNDPNGMVYYKGEYHLFYQYYPKDTKWGPMHWGHAVSKDLNHWHHLPVALKPDDLGYIFSGSAVVDKNNTTGFKSGKEDPLVAIFTHHNPKNKNQMQSIAYSTDKGRSWKKYDNNPVIKNPGIQNFRDPNVSWHKASQKWVMALAAGNQILFYTSEDLKKWRKVSGFGINTGAHGGVWECPDLFPLTTANGQKKWVLLVSVNPGGPSGGSATQYFIGDFDGKTFTPDHKDVRWIDYGADNYAGVTWSDTPNRRIFIGWMNNWLYADHLPTGKWRGAMTIPRVLSLKKVGDKLLLASAPVKETDNLGKVIYQKNNLERNSLPFQAEIGSEAFSSSHTVCNINMKRDAQFELTLGNKKDEHVVIGYDKAAQRLYLDRSRSGDVSLHPEFGAKHSVQPAEPLTSLRLDIYYDRSSVEVFVNDGLYVLTDRVFPSEYYSTVTLKGSGTLDVQNLKVSRMHSVWKNNDQ